MGQGHVVLLAFPSQGSVNPLLQLAKNLLGLGVKVTLLASLSVHRRRMLTRGASPTPPGLTLVTFSDGYDDGIGLKEGRRDVEHIRSELKRHSSKALSDLITTSAEEGHPVTGLVYVMLMQWAAEVAQSFNITPAALWVQPAAVLDIYYYYFNGYGDEIRRICNDHHQCSSSSSFVELPGLPKLASRDLPAYMLPSGSKSYGFAMPATKEQLDCFDAETNPKILVNTFDALESEALKAIEKYDLVAIGPLVPSVFLDGNDPNDAEFKSSDDYVKWLDSKPESSVVYVSFGSFVKLQKKQMEEVARGLLESNKPFLWVARLAQNGEEEEDGLMSCREELEKRGLIVPWCSQVEVLSHPSLGCFVTPCGWNSSLESLVSGVPVVGVPQFTDQPTNAKLLQDEFKTGVRALVNEEGIVGGDEIKRCIDLVMGGGESGVEMRRNAQKWKVLAKEALKEGGSSDVNLRDFVRQIGGAF